MSAPRAQLTSADNTPVARTGQHITERRSDHTNAYADAAFHRAFTSYTAPLRNLEQTRATAAFQKLVRDPKYPILLLDVFGCMATTKYGAEAGEMPLWNECGLPSERRHEEDWDGLSADKKDLFYGDGRDLQPAQHYRENDPAASVALMTQYRGTMNTVGDQDAVQWAYRQEDRDTRASNQKYVPPDQKSDAPEHNEATLYCPRLAQQLYFMVTTGAPTDTYAGRGRLTLREFQDNAIRYLDNIMLVAWFDEHGGVRIPAIPALGDIGYASLPGGADWMSVYRADQIASRERNSCPYLDASQPLKRNIIMALCGARSNDEIHVKSILGVEHHNFDQVNAMVLPTCALEFLNRYEYQLATGQDQLEVQIVDGIVRVDAIACGASFKRLPADGDGAENNECEKWLCSDDQYPHNTGRVYCVRGAANVMVPVLVHRERVVIDYRDDIPIPGLYHVDPPTNVAPVVEGGALSREHELAAGVYDEARFSSGARRRLQAALTASHAGNRHARWTTTQDLYEKGTLGMYSDGRLCQYRREPSKEPEYDPRLDLPRVSNVPFRDPINYGPGMKGRMAGFKNTVAFTSSSLDGQSGTFNQLYHRYGARVAGSSVMGTVLPIRVITAELLFVHSAQTAVSSAPFGALTLRSQGRYGFNRTRPDACAKKAIQFYDETYTIVDYLVKAPDFPAAFPIIAPLELDHPIDASVAIRGGTGATPTITEWATRLQRHGRRNAVGIALQRIEPGQPGDLMLHDSS